MIFKEDKMHIILDTHLLIWALYDSKTLPKGVREILESEDTDIEYSIVTLWETEIKHMKHPETFTFNCDELYKDAKAEGYSLMRLDPAHISTLGRLNDPTKRHRDPFDRILIAQAKYENAYLITHDKRIATYEEECVQYL